MSQSEKTDPDCEATLLPVQITDDRGCLAAVEIVAENGYLIRVSEQATAEHVRRVLQAVGGLR